ncbi:hypothetical protein ASG49_05000 [Marmoricola sp. Leaf446]|uniref:TOPRIM nucleotidyl transferase/hydrolase domain-containing protein n=1 Tax=Marmoricola sp. Leaf446 TaxID=1736379 RepID=UPI0006FD8527|nr:TOPRIM nucleotidyl transferase/hydrolase domain-containing protein [Marmoricola sp. Leaf446]KQT94256.1 hypothetical protein ASG49_05000 [Marmoricola sp. Leaf446]
METQRTVVLVEGESDRVALLALAARLGRDLASEGVEVVAMGGITNVRSHAVRWSGAGVTLTGLYDAPEEPQLRRGLRRAGLVVEGRNLADLGFHRCEVDLEDELLRALGADRAEAVIEAAGDGRSLRLLAQMPVQRDWPREAVLRRFLTSQGGRKARYARLFVEALDLDRVPAPLLAVVGPGTRDPGADPATRGSKDSPTQEAP